jgi:hypothetical protein
MRNLTLGDLKIGLKDFFDNRAVHFLLTKMGASYGPLIEAKRTAVDALPPSLTGGRPLADELSDTDAWHDGFGYAIRKVCEAILDLPTASPELKKAVQEAITTFVPVVRALHDTYGDEAAVAHKNRVHLERLEASLKSISVPTGETLHDWVKAFLDAGDQLGKLLSGRALIEAGTYSAAEITSLRMSTIGLIRRFRDGVADEMAARTDLPRNLDALIFGYFDELSDRRAKAPKSQVPVDPPPATTGTPADVKPVADIGTGPPE